MGFALLLGLFPTGQARVLVVVVAGGDEMFIRSLWLRQSLRTGAAGWLVPTANHSPWISPAWHPDLMLLDWHSGNSRSQTGRTDQPLLQPATPSATARFIPLLPDAELPFGVRTAPETLPEAWRQELDTARWVHVELGEVARALRYAEFCTPEQAEYLQQRAWQQIDYWLSFLARQYDLQRDLVIIVGSSQEEGKPWAVWLRGCDAGKGWLWDDSVRVQGAGQTMSLLTTVRAALGLPTSPAWGDYLHGKGSPATAEGLIACREAWLLRYSLWRGALWIRAAWIVLALLGLIWAYRVGREHKRRAAVRLRVVGKPSPPSPPTPSIRSLRALFTPATWGLWGIALGIASLFPAALPASAVWSAPLIVLLGTGLLFWLARVIDTPLVGLGAITGLGLIALMLDTLSGGEWNRNGLFGHTLLGGYRFYGIGNQYAALALSWAMILCVVWLRIEGLPLGALYFFALVTVWMGWQSSNVGATLATVGTLLVFGVSILRDQLHGRSRKMHIAHMLTLAGAALLSLGLLWLNTPHLRGFWAGVSGLSDSSDMADSLDMVIRKVMLNLGESLLSPWVVLLLASLVAVRSLRPMMPTVAIPRVLQYTWLTAGILCFLLNDLGTLMAAILAFHYWALIFTQIQQESPPHVPNRTYAMGGKR
ncbi:hypothetical protein HRbin15_01890 [bacterium HR15]|nr:hypothetical protein HRbin15_01890 [bacterium HR15]